MTRQPIHAETTDGNEQLTVFPESEAVDRTPITSPTHATGTVLTEDMGGNQVCPHRTIRSSATSQFKKNAETPVIAPRYSVGQWPRRWLVSPSPHQTCWCLPQWPCCHLMAQKLAFHSPIGRQSPPGCSPCTQSSTGDTCAIPLAASCRSSSFPCY